MTHAHSAVATGGEDVTVEPRVIEYHWSGSRLTFQWVVKTIGMWRRKWLLLMAGAGGGPTSRIRALHCFHSLCFPRRIQHHCSFVHFLRAFLWFRRYLERLWASWSFFWEWVEGYGPNIHLVIRSEDTTFLKSSSELIQFDENLWSYTAHRVKWIAVFIFKTKHKLITVSTFLYNSGNNIRHRTNFHWFYRNINHIFSIKSKKVTYYGIQRSPMIFVFVWMIWLKVFE